MIIVKFPGGILFSGHIKTDAHLHLSFAVKFMSRENWIHIFTENPIIPVSTMESLKILKVRFRRFRRYKHPHPELKSPKLYLTQCLYIMIDSHESTKSHSHESLKR